MTDIQALIERIQGGETGREVERSAFLALGYTEDAPEDGYIVASNDDGSESIIYGHLLMLTRSMDACIALLERVLPDHYYNIGKGRETPDEPMYGARILRPFTGREVSCGESDVSLAAALLIAILKAFEAEGSGE